MIERTTLDLAKVREHFNALIEFDANPDEVEFPPYEYFLCYTIGGNNSRDAFQTLYREGYPPSNLQPNHPAFATVEVCHAVCCWGSSTVLTHVCCSAATAGDDATDGDEKQDGRDSNE